MKNKSTQKKIYLDEDVNKFLNQNVDNHSRYINELIRSDMGPAYKKRRIEAELEDNPENLEALAELEEIERQKESDEYKIRFMECQLRVIREYEANGLIRGTVRDAISFNLDMDKLEVLDFIHNTLEDLENKVIEKIGIESELKILEQDNYIVEVNKKEPIRHDTVGEYIPNLL